MSNPQTAFNDHSHPGDTDGWTDMGLIAFLKRLFGGASEESHAGSRDVGAEVPFDIRDGQPPPSGGQPPAAYQSRRGRFRCPVSIRYAPRVNRTKKGRVVSVAPYRFANRDLPTRGYIDLTEDHDPEQLARFGLPLLRTPEEIANWLEVPLPKLAWLIGRFHDNRRPQSEAEAHYHFHWVRKKSGGYRLIEAPKSLLKEVQIRILRGILDLVAAHPAAHGFVPGRSIRSNAAPHVGQAWILKLDLSNFYPSVSFNRVVAIFRSLGYCREAAIWLGKLTTSAIPSNLNAPDQRMGTVWPYLRRHLPQGAPTSPAIANLSAFGLDLRLTGLAGAYGLRYTRYADDLTLSGPQRAVAALREIIPFATTIIGWERFRLNKAKRRVLRRYQQQTVTGLVVNDQLGIPRAEFDRLKAILTNCLRHGPASQNRNRHPQFAAHLLGRIGHLASVNPARGMKLRTLYDRIDWSK